jgi:hypothetical protein
MNWQAIGAMGEAIGALAVVLTLGYLAVQVRDTRKLLRANAHQARTDRNIQILLGRLHFPPPSLEKINSGQELSSDELSNLQAHNAIGLRHFEDLFYQHSLGLVDDETWEANQFGLEYIANRFMRPVMGEGENSEWLDLRMYRSEFAEHLRGLLQK